MSCAGASTSDATVRSTGNTDIELFSPSFRGEPFNFWGAAGLNDGFSGMRNGPETLSAQVFPQTETKVTEDTYVTFGTENPVVTRVCENPCVTFGKKALAITGAFLEGFRCKVTKKRKIRRT